MSTETTNLKLIKPSSDDIVDVEVFEHNFDELDKLGVDYIIEQSSASPASLSYGSYPIEGNWYYRKWKSGWIEMWGSFNVKGVGSKECIIQYPNGIVLNTSGIVCTATCKQSGNINSYLRHCSAVNAGLDIYAGGVTAEGTDQIFSTHIFGKYQKTGEV